MALAFVPPPPDPTEFLRRIKTLIPQFGRLRLDQTIILLAALQEVPALIRRRLEKAVDEDSKEEDDSKKVVKVSDAIDCVDEHLRDPDNLLALARMIVAEITKMSSGSLPDLSNFIMDIAKCIREKALRQDSKRKRITYRYAKREI